MATLQQSQYKRMKKQVLEETAVGVGYFGGIMSAIPSYALVEATREVSRLQWIKDTMTDSEVENILVTESIRALNFQDFKAVAPYLFSYPREVREADRLARPVEVSRAEFEALQDQARELFQLKEKDRSPTTMADLVTSIEMSQTTVPSGYNVIGVNPITDEYMISYKDDSAYHSIALNEGILDHDYLINDYSSHLSDEAQIVNHLITNHPISEPYVYEYFNDLYFEATGQLDGSDLVEDYFNDEGLNFDVSVTSTADLYYLAQESERFKRDFPDYKSFLLETVSHDYMFENAHHLLESDDYMGLINNALTKEGCQLTIEHVRGYSQGDSWALGAIYPTDQASEEDIQDFLVHKVGAAYKGSLVEVFINDGDTITHLGIDQAKFETSNYLVIDDELLLGDDALEVLKERMQVSGFMTLEDAEAFLEESKQKDTLDEAKGRTL